MRLLGKYTFERLRDCLQGVFAMEYTKDTVTVDLWQLRIIIKAHDSIGFYINEGEQKGYICLGKLGLT